MIESNDPKKAKDLTIGSLIGNGFMLGLEDTDKKLALKVFQLAGELQEAMEKNDGKYEVDIDTIDLLEEYYSKIKSSTFTLPLHSGAVYGALHNARLDLLTKQNPVKQ